MPSKFASSSYQLSVPNVGGSVSDYDWQYISQSYANCWLQAADDLQEQRVNAYGSDITVTFDWSPFQRRMRRYIRVMDEINSCRGSEEELRKAARKFPRRRIVIKILSEATPSLEKEFQHKFVVESLIHDVYLITNLAAPGACDFYKSQLEGGLDYRNRKEKLSVDLANYKFDLAMVESREGKWPYLDVLSISDVREWYREVRPGVLQMPENRMEKVLFAIMHMVKLEMNPFIAVWIFYALETLFDTKPGENLRTLLERISLLLGISNKEHSILKKRLRTLYDLRSSLVHGGYSVVHPMMYEGLTEKGEIDHRKWMEPSDFGFRLLICCLQAIILRGWRWPEYDARIYGA